MLDKQSNQGGLNESIIYNAFSFRWNVVLEMEDGDRR